MSNNAAKHQGNSQVNKEQSSLAQAINKAIMCTALALPLALQPLTAEAQEAAKNIQVQAGDLGTAISNFAAKNGVVIYFDSSLTQGMRTEGLNGEYSVSEGLMQLLEGSNLKVVKEADGSYRLINLAADNSSVMNFASMLVEAEVSRREPGNIFIESNQLARTQASTIEDIFAGESSVAVGSGSAVGHKIYVRGFEDVMLNVTVDGAQTPAELYHHQARVQLEPEFIKTIELDAGAGPATNGAGALTGALKITLKNADDMLDGDRNWGAFVKGTGILNGNNGDKYTASAYGRLTESTGLIVGFTRENRDDYEDGNGNILDAATYDRTRVFVKLNSSIEDHEFSFTLENLDDEATTFERPNLTNFRGSFLLSDQEMRRNTIALNYAYNPENDFVDVKTTFYRNDSDFKVQRQSSTIIYGEGDFVSTGFDIRNTSVLANHYITYGIDYRSDELESAQNATPPFEWGSTEQSATVKGLYLQDKWHINDVFDITAGLRYDDYNFDGDGGISDGVSMSDSGLSPNIGMSWELLPGLVLSTTYAQAFRGVAIREAFFSGLYLHDGSLESEEADNLEIGISYETDRFFARATAYQQNIDNFIDIEFTGGATWGYWRNVGDAKVKGYEAEIGITLDNLNATLGVWDAHNSLNGEALVDNNMGLGTSIGRTWLAKVDYLADRWSAGARLRYVENKKNEIANNAPDKKAFAVTSVYANWEPVKKLRVSIAVNNLFDKFYYDHATYTYIGGSDNDYVGYPGMGREIVASLSYRF